MGTFFNGWRRKLGVVALIASSGMAMLWIRGGFKSDQIGVEGIGGVRLLTGGIELYLVESQTPITGRPFWVSSDTKPFDHEQGSGGWSAMGFRYFFIVGFVVVTKHFAIPYGFLALPLALLSAWLLLSRPKRLQGDRCKD